MVVIAAVVTAAAAAVMPAPPATTGACAGLIADRDAAARRRRPITADDLVRLRDLGSVDDRTGPPSPLAISPDRRRLALVLRRGDPTTNTYCVALVTIATQGPAKPTVLDEGDELLRYADLNRGLNLGGTGVPVLLTPHWSPDGTWIAYIRQVHGVAQLWRARADGSGSVQVTHLADDVDDLAWTSDGQGIVFSHSPAIATADAAIAAEGRAGFLYDRRTWALAAARPAPPAALPTTVETIILATATMHPASDAERGALAPVARSAPPATTLWAVAPAGDRAAFVGPAADGFLAPTRLRVTLNGTTLACPWTACGSGTAALWWDRDGALVWLRTEDEGDAGQMALYRWTLGRAPPRRLMRTTHLIAGCTMGEDARSFCTLESSNRPRQVVRLDLRNGNIRPLYDPNPSFDRIALGAVRRLVWSDAYGIRTFGDLVLPPGHRPGQIHPLIVVQYQSRGFLRGGTGDEYPIQLFAAHGFAVLSVNRSTSKSGLAPAPDADAYQHRAIPGSTYRRRTLALVEAGVAAALRTGTIDAAHIGITGTSDGALTACFGLIHSRLFAAAALSSGCEEPITEIAMVGPAYTEDLVRWGYPYPDRDPAGFWQDNALSRHAEGWTVPILIQAADHEYRLALETVAAFQEYHRPIELIVFPDEFHLKWQPAHRLAIYQRNVDWFDFWLRGIERPDPAAVAQYARWRALRAALADVTTNSAPMPRHPAAPAAVVAGPDRAR